MDSFSYHEMTEKKLRDAAARPRSLLLKGNHGSGMHHAAVKLAEGYLRAGTLEGHPDFMEVASEDGKEITKDMILDVIDFARRLPLSGKFRVAVIDDAERMNKAAQNSLLKTLEENRTCLFIFVAHRNLLDTVENRIEEIRFLPVTEGLDTHHPAYFASAGTPGAYQRILEDPVFLEFLGKLPEALLDRKECLRLFSAGSIREKTFFETESREKVGYLFCFLEEGLKQAVLAAAGHFRLEECFCSLGGLSDARLEVMLATTRKCRKEFEESRIFSKNDFFLYLLTITEEEEQK